MFRPILDVKAAKLGLVRGLLDKKIDLVSRKRNFWGQGIVGTQNI